MGDQEAWRLTLRAKGLRVDAGNINGNAGLSALLGILGKVVGGAAGDEEAAAEEQTEEAAAEEQTEEAAAEAQPEGGDGEDDRG